MDNDDWFVWINPGNADHVLRAVHSTGAFVKSPAQTANAANELLA